MFKCSYPSNECTCFFLVLTGAKVQKSCVQNWKPGPGQAQNQLKIHGSGNLGLNEEEVGGNIVANIKRLIIILYQSEHTPTYFNENVKVQRQKLS